LSAYSGGAGGGGFGGPSPPPQADNDIPMTANPITNKLRRFRYSFIVPPRVMISNFYLTFFLYFLFPYLIAATLSREMNSLKGIGPNRRDEGKDTKILNRQK
jgi:hypothetical protein